MPKRNKSPAIKKLPLANKDLREIWRYIARDSESAATNFIKKLHEKFVILARNPFVGRLRDELSDELRSHPVGNYLIFYRIAEDGIDIVRVLHGSRDLPSLAFADDDEDK